VLKNIWENRGLMNDGFANNENNNRSKIKGYYRMPKPLTSVTCRREKVKTIIKLKKFSGVMKTHYFTFISIHG